MNSLIENNKGSELTRTSAEPFSSYEEVRQRNVCTFDNAGLSELYRPVSSYEGIHRYDPAFEWQRHEESNVVRKVCALQLSQEFSHKAYDMKLDYRITAWICLTFFCLVLDSTNFKQALANNLLEELNLSTDDLNTAQTIYHVSLLITELPSQLLAKWIGPNRYIPIQISCWSIVACCQAFLTGRSSLFATRALLGIIESGLISECILYLSYFFTSTELPKRVSLLFMTGQLTTIIGAFLAYGVLHMDGTNGQSGWRWLFALEGAFTGLVGLITFFYLPPSSTQTQGGIRGRMGWFSEREEKIMVNRVLRDDPSKGTMHNREAVSWSMLWSCLRDVDMWPIYIVGISIGIPTHPVSSYLTLHMRSSGFDTFQTNLLSVPPSCIFILNLLLWTWLSERVNERFLISLMSQIWCIPFMIALEVLPAHKLSKWVHYALSVLVIGHPSATAILNSVVSRNSGSVRTRTVAAAIFSMTCQIGSIISSNIYRENDKPLYRIGNKIILAIIAFNIVLLVAVRWYYSRKNKQRSKQWEAMSQEAKELYVTTTKVQGNRRLDFRFAY